MNNKPAITTDSERRLGIVMTVNARYLREAEDDYFGFGVVGFVLAAAHALSARGQFLGLVAYRREEATAVPRIHETRIAGFPAVEFTFNFACDLKELQQGFRAAVNLILRSRQDAQTIAPTPIIYHQSNALLHLTPPSIPFLITHHGPFAQQIRTIFGDEFAARAFQGGQPKLYHLTAVQERGLDILRRSPAAAALEMSRVQAEVLRTENIPEAKIHRAPPPLLAPVARPHNEVHSPYRSELRPGALHVMSAAARIDPFKNFDYLISCVNEAHRRGAVGQLSLFVGTPADEQERRALFDKVVPGLKMNTVVAPRMRHSQMLDMFRKHAGFSVFVCSSLYETYGLTALEAMLCGLATLVPNDLTQIGIAEYVSVEDRFDIRRDGLTFKLIQYASDGCACRRGLYQRERAINLTGPELFLQGFDLAIEDMLRTSSSAERRQPEYILEGAAST